MNGPLCGVETRTRGLGGCLGEAERRIGRRPERTEFESSGPVGPEGPAPGGSPCDCGGRHRSKRFATVIVEHCSHSGRLTAILEAVACDASLEEVKLGIDDVANDLRRQRELAEQNERDRQATAEAQERLRRDELARTAEPVRSLAREYMQWARRHNVDAPAAGQVEGLSWFRTKRRRAVGQQRWLVAHRTVAVSNDDYGMAYNHWYLWVDASGEVTARAGLLEGDAAIAAWPLAEVERGIAETVVRTGIPWSP